jgi:hypothetical protein
MRVLSIVCGVAVLITALHGVHAIHHFLHFAVNGGSHSAEVWAGAAGAALIAVFAFTGGILLLVRGK